ASGRARRSFVAVTTGIRSIVARPCASAAARLFVAAFLGPGPAQRQMVELGLTASIALSVLMIPVAVRSTEEMLRVVPNELREASYALGVRKWKTIMKVVLPTSIRSEEHTSELQSRFDLVCRL